MEQQELFTPLMEQEKIFTHLSLSLPPPYLSVLCGGPLGVTFPLSYMSRLPNLALALSYKFEAPLSISMHTASN